MSIKHLEEYRNPALARVLIDKIKSAHHKEICLMEVCGTHTMAIFRHGIRDVIPASVKLLSGPGCPVCVTAQEEIDAFIALSRQKDVIIATFGDLMRVPGTESSLNQERSRGRDIRVVYGAADALVLARENPRKHIVFLGVGFETTAPTIAASILTAQTEKRTNFHVFSAHKRIPPALMALFARPQTKIDGLLLPGHVSVIIGENAYLPFVEKKRLPSVIMGFEPIDILDALWRMILMIESGQPALENAYPRSVTKEGNPMAQNILASVFEVTDAKWRGIGVIPGSGLKLRKTFAAFDARAIYDYELPQPQTPSKCECGQILLGEKRPLDCPLYRKGCTPENPKGPCMVSSEGTCAAFYRYHKENSDNR